MTVMRDAGRFDSGRGAVTPWLCGIAKNHLRQRLARDRRLEPLAHDEEPAAEATAAEADALGELIRAERVESLRRAVLSLPFRYREVVVLCDLQELSYQDAADALACAVGTVRSRLHRGRALLAVKLAAAAAGANRGGDATGRVPARGTGWPDANGGGNRSSTRRVSVMSCQRFEADLVDFARGTLEDGEAAAACRRHLEACQACAARFERERRLTDGLRMLSAATSVPANDVAERRLMMAFASARRPRRRRSGTPWPSGGRCGRRQPASSSSSARGRLSSGARGRRRRRQRRPRSRHRCRRPPNRQGRSSRRRARYRLPPRSRPTRGARRRRAWFGQRRRTNFPRKPIGSRASSRCRRPAASLGSTAG